jgi:glycosyltransferase involved in cell wall biosynthesis
MLKAEPMKLDVIIPTYNRSDLLKRTLDSLRTARVPEGLSVRVTVVDNNSKDDTRQVVEDYMKSFGSRLNYLFEGQQGRSNALNAGIAATDGDLIGMIDDDEEIDGNWYARVHSAFSEDKVDFVGGPYKPRWGASPPAWLPKDYPAVIGWIEGGDEVLVYGENYDGVLMGGNAVITRSMLRRVGYYSTSLGRSGKRLLSVEDEDMTERLLATGGRGLYLPDLVIHHYIPPERLTKSYHRRWCFWRGVSLGVKDRDRKAPVADLLGVPRYLYGRAARALFTAGHAALGKGKDAAQRFSDELAIWDLIGFFYGKHFYRPAR